MRSYWSKYGPPLHISAVVIAASLGIDLLSKQSGGEVEGPILDPRPEQSIDAIAEQLPLVPPGGDTWKATLEAIRLMGGA